jgi:hypothetical protein
VVAVAVESFYNNRI